MTPATQKFQYPIRVDEIENVRAHTDSSSTKTFQYPIRVDEIENIEIALSIGELSIGFSTLFGSMRLRTEWASEGEEDNNEFQYPIRVDEIENAVLKGQTREIRSFQYPIRVDEIENPYSSKTNQPPFPCFSTLFGSMRLRTLAVMAENGVKGGFSTLFGSMRLRTVYALSRSRLHT